MVLPPLIPSIASQAAPEKEEADPFASEKAQCSADGGTWDPENNVCILPKQEEIKEEEKQPTSFSSENMTPEEYEAARVAAGFEPTDKSKFGTLRDAETGRLSGFEVGGKTFIGNLSPEEVRGQVEAEAAKQELQVGGQAEQVLTQRQQELQSQGLDLSAQVGNDPISQLQRQFSSQEVDYVAALASGVPGLLPDLVSGGIAGGLAGTSAAVPTGGLSIPAVAVLGAVGLAARGFYRDFVSDVKQQKGELIETPIRTLTETKTILNDITGAQNANPADAADNLEAFNQQLQLIDNEYDRLKDLTDDDLNKFLGENGINQIQEYEVYYSVGGERDRQITDFQLALANPDPTRVKPSTVTLEQINKRIEEEISKL